MGRSQTDLYGKKVGQSSRKGKCIDSSDLFVWHLEILKDRCTTRKENKDRERRCRFGSLKDNSVPLILYFLMGQRRAVLTFRSNIFDSVTRCQSPSQRWWSETIKSTPTPFKDLIKNGVTNKSTDRKGPGPFKNLVSGPHPCSWWGPIEATNSRKE